MESDELRNRNSEEDSVGFQIEDLPLKHSGIGIASFVVSLVMGLLLFVVIANIIAKQFPEPYSPNKPYNESLKSIVLGLLTVCIGFLDLIALGLGIGGLLQKNSKKKLAKYSVIFSGFVLISFCLIIIFRLSV